MYEFEGNRPRNLVYYEGWGTFALVEEYFERIMKEIGDGQWDEVYTLLDAYMLFVHRSCPRPTSTAIVLTPSITEVTYFCRHPGRAKESPLI